MLEMTIRDVVGSAVYEGQSYTYTVMTETPGGAVVPLEASARLLSEDDIGSTVEIEVNAQSVQPITVATEPEAELVPGEYGSVDIHGHLIDIHLDAQHPLEISIGDGSLRADVLDIEDVTPGDWIVITGAQLYLEDIEWESYS